MSIPSYDAMYLPLLKSLADCNIHQNKEMGDFIAEEMAISPEDRQKQTLNSGKSIFSDRVNWACTYLKKAGLVKSVKRGHQQITEEGLRILSAPPDILDNEFLCRYPSFQSFYHPDPKDSDHRLKQSGSNDTPNDLIEQAFSSINQNLSDELLAEIMAKDPQFFESLVIKLLLKMGYGGSESDSGFVTQQSNDGGIDGIIREDKLGFDQIYIQAKRWDPEKTINRPEIQKFSGALRDESASKGLFITTAKFSDGAKVSADKQHIVLVDGARLTKLMIEYGIGVSTIATYEIKSIDSDFFADNDD